MKKLMFYMISLLVIIMAGCGGTKDFQVKLSTPNTFTEGKTYPMQIKITDQKGNPVKGAHVTAELNMKTMDHGTIPVTVEETEDGKYIGLSKLAMNGDWIATIKVERNGKSVEEEKEFSAEAATKENAHRVTKQVSLPDFNLKDQNGNQITKKDFLGKAVVLTFTYVKCADPNACPVLLANFRNLQEDLKTRGIDTDKILLASVTVDPENDTPQAMNKHAKEINFDMTYLKMLTGKMSEIKKVANTLGEHFEKQGNVVMHDNKTFIFNPNGELTHEFTGSMIDREELFQVVAENK
ncbi:FixH family protein [Bacillus sp. UNC438CL73TsuS30]|uniref:FixH family protein n=1 Tax=Bacillus sp. UNC438CL73TsuS30 TaxID=1340434 RepID=UPI00047DA6F4|nr:FixH family protein [Bacillus sp. UNC438CL73TsuS30]